MSTNGPTTELGALTATGPGPLLPWTGFLDDKEYVPELTWPTSISAYDRMRTDTQNAGILLGMTLPIRRYDWRLNPNGARPEVVAAIARDLNLPILDTDPPPRRRSRRRFSWDRHLQHALLSLTYGHYYFEQVGEVEDDGLWHLRKLAPRPPHTIVEIKVAGDGGLVSIKQNTGTNSPEIPVDRLVAYVWQQEAGSWIGRSILRPIYKNWLIKDRLLRVDALKHERNGMGVPWIEAPPNSSKAQIDALAAVAQGYKAGEASGGAGPNGAKLSLIGVSGSIPDTIQSIRYHDEAAARSLLMMFMQLGQTETGSRALGSEFIDYFQLAQETLAIWITDVFNEHVIEDYVDWNWGEDEELTPLLTWQRDDDPEAPVEPLETLAENGTITLPEETLAGIREGKRRRATRHNANRAPRRYKANAGDLPAKKLRRQPYDHELRAKVDFEDLDKQYKTALNSIVKEWEGIQLNQIDELRNQIAAATTLEELALLQASPQGAAALQDRLEKMLDHGIKTAQLEAARQGHTLPEPDMDALTERMAARAAAVDALLAKGLSEAAGRRAVALSGGAFGPAEVGDMVRDYLGGLTNSYLIDQLGGTLTQALNTGRREAIRGGAPSYIYASELLDDATCDACTDVDGKEYPNIDEAEYDYPSGGYVDCLGGPRCRGTLVAVYDEAEPEGDDES